MANENDKQPIRLRTISDLADAHEWLFNEQRAGNIDAKTADALNTTLKGSVYLMGKLRLEYAKLILASAIKKIKIPERLLPNIEGEW